MLKRNSIDIEEKELASWYAATGFYLPRTVGELRRFEKLYNDYKYQLNGDELDPNNIFFGNLIAQTENISMKNEFEIEPFRMAARGLKEIPLSVRRKMLENQKSIQDDTK